MSYKFAGQITEIHPPNKINSSLTIQRIVIEDNERNTACFQFVKNSHQDNTGLLSKYKEGDFVRVFYKPYWRDPFQNLTAFKIEKG